MTNQQTIVFFVGADMTGKTHIAKEFCRIMQLPYYKCSTEHYAFLNKQDRFINDLRFGVTHLLDVLTQTNYSIVFDRGYPCEWVYSRIFNRQTDEQILRIVDDGYANLNAKIVLCSRSTFSGITDDLDTTIDCDKLTKINNEYLKFVNTFTKCKTFILNVDDENLTREVKDVIDFVYD